MNPRQSMALALIAALALVGSACSSTDSTEKDSGGGNGPDPDGPVAQVDKGIVPDLGTADSGGASCGEGIYPCGPYGTSKGDVIEDVTFVGFADPDTFCKPLKDQAIDFSKSKKFSFGDWHRPPEGCPDKKKQLMWVVVSAGWCGPCRAEIQETMAAIKQGAIDDRLALVDILFEDDNAQPATESYAKNLWAQYVGITFPLLLDPSFKMGKYFDREAVPFNMLVDLETMKIVFRATGANLPAVGQAIQSFFQNK